ncbi:DNA-protecting protein DprA [Candidatus Falkowbacteria bacterium HGW-Falkowbacteria-2]|uniref:DNA-protecting protein DprA n=1 Tax=Candidatus Falkowbacteria bacterium HGW-Falkowbacteria-2 TaxID=2013769 RepID=A0A2N2E0Y1_9BACT|nr:MAG: DNA-protecting protein DprA [Candidatus Falkowbacteria bacterium HGW-Falkowbacteria-2]
MSSPYYQQTDDLFLAALASIPGLGPKRLGLLGNEFGSWQEAFTAPESSWRNHKIPAASIKYWQTGRNKFSPAKLIDYLNTTRTYLITPKHDKYFSGFRDLDDAPPLLYARGDWPSPGNIITVIGSRLPTSSAELATKRYTSHLASANSIASGLAAGIDTITHRTALKAKGHTIAILGSGLDYIYPRDNAKLAQDTISAGGLLISEYPPSTSPLKAHFIRRNRLLAAIAQQVLVIEAGLKSGTINTARLAMRLKRPTFAVPSNPTNALTAGCQQLIAEGANIAGEPSPNLTAQE